MDIETERVLRRLKLSDLRLLRAVVEWGGVAKAARQLNVSQPAVSKALASMEHAVGVRLVDRTTRGVRATMYGEALLSCGTTVFDELTQSLNRIRFLSDPSAGLVRIGCTETGAASFVPTVIAKFAQERTRVLFEVTTADPMTLVEQRLVQRHVDLVIGALPIIRTKNDFDVVRLFPDRMVVMASRKSKWARRREIKLSDLVDESWVLPPSGTEPANLIADAFRKAGATPPRRVVTGFSIPLILHLLARGDHLAMLPALLARFSPHLHLKALPVSFPGVPREVGIVTLRNRTVGPLTKLFIDCARKLAASVQP